MKELNIREYLEEEKLKRLVYKNNIYNINIDKNNILDSSLISQSNRKLTNIRLVKCGDYLQLYFFPDNTYTTDKNLEKVNKIFLPITTNERHNKDLKLKVIELKNINRSKLNLQNLIKTNEKDFKTFFTLTFEENIIDVKEANRRFNIWRRNFKRLFPDFKYVCVPEFQSRGAVHYHLMTNVDYNHSKLLSQNERRIYKPGSGWNVGKDVKGWCYGHSMAKNIESINLVGYITKYMTKDIDNRLFSQHRYFYSQNLIKPQEYNFDLSSFQDASKWFWLDYNFKEMTYCKVYKDKFEDDIVFVEYKLAGSDNIYYVKFCLKYNLFIFYFTLFYSIFVLF